MTETTVKLSPATVEVGMGVTMCMWSDRVAGTVTKVSPSGKTFEWQRDTAKPRGPIHDREQYDYDYAPNPLSPVRVARWSAKRGAFISGGSRMTDGRHEYYDPTF